MSLLEDVLDIDLNDVVSKSITKKIKSLESEIKRLRENADKQSSEIAALKKEAKMASIANGLIDNLRLRYDACAEVKDRDGRISLTEPQAKYAFMREVAKLVYGITLDEAIVSARSSHSSLAYAARDHKEIVCNLLTMLDKSQWVGNKIAAIKEFRMPKDYSKGAIFDFIRKPHYGYNGSKFGIIQSWVESDFQMAYTPYDLLMKSPHFVSEEGFALVVESIKNNVEYSHEFFAMAKCSIGVTLEQIKTLGALAADIPIKGDQNSTHHGRFIAEQMKNFNPEDIDKLFVKMNISGSDWSALHWGIFPIEYQMKAFRKMDFATLTQTINGYYSKMPASQKEAVYADWFHFNPHPHTPRAPK